MRTIVALLIMTSAAGAHGYRWDMHRNGYSVTVTQRPVYLDDGMRRIEEEVPPNACDKKGTPGFEVITGDRRGCFGRQ